MLDVEYLSHKQCLKEVWRMTNDSFVLHLLLMNEAPSLVFLRHVLFHALTFKLKYVVERFCLFPDFVFPFEKTMPSFRVKE